MKYQKGKMLNSKSVHGQFLQVHNNNTLAKRIDDDVAKSMPNIAQSIPSSTLVRNEIYKKTFIIYLYITLVRFKVQIYL